MCVQTNTVNDRKKKMKKTNDKLKNVYNVLSFRCTGINGVFLAFSYIERNYVDRSTLLCSKRVFSRVLFFNVRWLFSFNTVEINIEVFIKYNKIRQ